MIAAKARGALIDACAAYRENDSQVRALFAAVIMPHVAPTAEVLFLVCMSEQLCQQACGLQEALFQLLRIAGLLESLPLPPRSPHADMVAASISQRATLREREVSSSSFVVSMHEQKQNLPFCIYTFCS